VVDQTFKVAVDPFFDGNEMEIGLSQEYPMSEIKMEMVVCRNLRLPEPGQDEREQAARRYSDEEGDEADPMRDDEGRDDEVDLENPNMPEEPMELVGDELQPLVEDEAINI